jgi:hypothetical protein
MVFATQTREGMLILRDQQKVMSSFLEEHMLWKKFRAHDNQNTKHTYIEW